MSIYLQVLLMANLLWNCGILHKSLSTHKFDCFFVEYKGDMENRLIY